MVNCGFASKPWAQDEATQGLLTSLSATEGCHVQGGGLVREFPLNLSLPWNPRKRGGHWVKGRLSRSGGWGGRIHTYAQFGKVCVMLFQSRSLPPQTIRIPKGKASDPCSGGLFSHRTRKQPTNHVKNLRYSLC